MKRVLLFDEDNMNMPPHSKYAKIERERRFLLADFPGAANVVRTRHITDRYL